MFNLQGASYLQEVAVTASVAVKDTIKAAVTNTVKVAVTASPTVKDADKIVVTPFVDSNVSGKDVVTSTQPTHDAVIIEDASDDDLPLSHFIKVHSKPYISMHAGTTHTHASRMSEGDKKKREVKEKRSKSKHERQPNKLEKGEGLEHV